MTDRVPAGALTLVVRPSVAGVVCSGCVLVADLTWLALARPPGLQLLVTWFGALALAGVFVPGLANQVTLVRAHLAGPALVYSLLPGRLVELAAVVGLAGLSDMVDGTVARRLERPSRLGGGLDPVVDGVFFGAAAVGLAVGGAYPLWLALVVVARYGLPATVGATLILARRRWRPCSPSPTCSGPTGSRSWAVPEPPGLLGREGRLGSAALDGELAVPCTGNPP